MSINKVILVGHVGKDPIVRYFDKGVAHAAFSLATSEAYTNRQGETITSTEWHNIVLWRELAQVAEKNVHKGSQLYITGKIKTRSYVDKDGATKYITEILADTLIVLEKKQQAGYPAEPPQSSGFSGNTAAEPQAAYDAGNTAQANDAKSDAVFDSSEFAGNDEDDLPF